MSGEDKKWPVSHPDAKAQQRVFEDAYSRDDAEGMKRAFDALHNVCGALEMTMYHLAALYGEKHPTDTAPLERVATAAIRLAEQVVAKVRIGESTDAE